MWCDDFDMDLYKAIPEAKRILEPVKDIPLFTHGSLTDGKLNHPSVWNGYHGTIAFFGFENPAKLEGYWTDWPVIQCTFEEAVRDAWPHDYLIIVEREPVWDAFSLRHQFDDIMWHIRGLDKESLRDIRPAKQKVLTSLASACQKVARLYFPYWHEPEASLRDEFEATFGPESEKREEGI